MTLANTSATMEKGRDDSWKGIINIREILDIFGTWFGRFFFVNEHPQHTQTFWVPARNIDGGRHTKKRKNA